MKKILILCALIMTVLTNAKEIEKNTTNISKQNVAKDIEVIATLNKNKYSLLEPVQLEITILNRSNHNIGISSIDPFGKLHLSITKNSSKEKVSMTKLGERSKDYNGGARYIRVIKPNHKYTVVFKELKNYFDLSVNGEYDLNINGAYSTNGLFGSVKSFKFKKIKFSVNNSYNNTDEKITKID